MNTKRWMIGALAAGLLPVGLAMAQPVDEPEMGPGPGPRPGCERMGPGGPCGPERPDRPEGPGRGEGILQMFDHITKMLPNRLDLTAEQMEKFKALTTQNRAELEELVKKLEAQRTKFDADLNAILTPEQQTKLKELKERREKMMEGFKGRMGQGQGPGMGRGPREGMGPDGRMGERPRAAGPAFMLKAIEKLNLPEERANKAKEIVEQSKKEMIEAPRGDRDARIKIMKDTMTKLGEVLTPEEMQTFKETMREMRPMGPRGERGPMGEGPGRKQRGMKGQEPKQGPPECPATCVSDETCD